MSLYVDEEAKTAVTDFIAKAWDNLQFSAEIESLLDIDGKPTFDNVIDWVVNDEMTEENIMRKTIRSKAVSMYQRELKKNNKTMEQTTFSQIVAPKKAPKGKTKRLEVDLVERNVFENEDWTKGITKYDLDLVRVGLATFSSFASCFIYVKNGINYVAKFVGKAGKKTIEFVSI